MFYVSCVIYILVELCGSQERMQGWNYINLHCRNNENEPVDWWYIYKPPLDEAPKLDTGGNFSYITSDTTRWMTSNRFINSNSMLQHTLSPLYRPTYVNLAALAYTDRKDTSSARGVMMADEVAGVWVGHSVPGLLDFTDDRPSFPASELSNGHVIICLSLSHDSLNSIAPYIRAANPKILLNKLPESIKNILPAWKQFDQSLQRVRDTNSFILKPITFETTDGSIRAVILVRSPGENNCLYGEFAQANKIILDVYRHDKQAFHGCRKSFGVRRIDSISMKYAESVYYINNSSDRFSFAVSTAAHWQRKGDGPQQYWACTGTAENEESKGGIVVCVQTYTVWWNFDNLKVKEPRC